MSFSSSIVTSIVVSLFNNSSSFSQFFNNLFLYSHNLPPIIFDRGVGNNNTSFAKNF